MSFLDTLSPMWSQYLIFDNPNKLTYDLCSVVTRYGQLLYNVETTYNIFLPIFISLTSKSLLYLQVIENVLKRYMKFIKQQSILNLWFGQVVVPGALIGNHYQWMVRNQFFLWGSYLPTFTNLNKETLNDVTNKF